MSGETGSSQQGLTGDDIRTALLRANYYPDQSANHDEIPPCFNSATFTDGAAAALVAEFPNIKARKGGYDETAFRMTRHDLVPRVASLPHPIPYAHLVTELADNWSEFAFVEDNRVSQVRPRKRDDDERIIIRGGYDEEVDELDILFDGFDGADEAEDDAGGVGVAALPANSVSNCQVHADISTFFPSVYSHSVAWALGGKETAKSQRGLEHYFNRIDAALQATRRGETKGISIGPGTSNIVSEAILGRVDAILLQEFAYTRYIDDYTLFAASEAEGRQFIERLEFELSEYRLTLNPRKTMILPLPRAADEPWVNQLKLLAPDVDSLKKFGSYLDLAVSLGSDFPDGSTIKYASRRLLSLLDPREVPEWLADRLIGLAFHRPILLPLLREVYETSPALVSRHLPALKAIGLTGARYRRSDVMCWVLYYLGSAGETVPDEFAQSVLRSRDPLSLTTLWDIGDEATKASVVELLSSLSSEHPQDLDQFWVPFQTLHAQGVLANPYTSDQGFDLLQQHGVTFYSPIQSSQDWFGF